MSRVGFGKGKDFAHKASQSLTQGIEPALDRIGQTAVLAHRLMPILSENPVVGVPEITEGGTTLVGQRGAAPPLQATGFTAIPDDVGYRLPRQPTQGDPRSGEKLTILVGHTASIEAMAFNAAGSLIVTTGHDGIVRLWGIG